MTLTMAPGIPEILESLLQEIPRILFFPIFPPSDLRQAAIPLTTWYMKLKVVCCISAPLNRYLAYVPRLVLKNPDLIFKNYSNFFHESHSLIKIIIQSESTASN